MKSVRPIDCLFFFPQISTPPQTLGDADAKPLFGLPCPTNVGETLAAMDRYGIERVLLTPCHAGSNGCDRQYLCDEIPASEFQHHVGMAPQRFSALVGYNAFDIEQSLRDLQTAWQNGGVKGLYLTSRSTSLLDRRMYPAYAKCAELKLPVMFHTDHESAWAETWPEFQEVATVAADFPELRLIIACACWPPVMSMRTLLERNESIFFAVDANPRIDLTAEVTTFLNSETGRQRCLWGSNGCCWDTALAKLDALPLDAETRRLFARENAIRVFGLEKQDRPQFEVEFVLTGE